MSCNIQRRRGITLLFVISLIVLFLLMGATFVVISGNFMRVSEARTNLEVRGDSPPTILNRALMDLLRGTNNPNSILNTPSLTAPLVPRDHSILGDMYAPGFTANVTSASVDASSDGQLIRLVLDNSPSDVLGEYGGRVLTFISNSPNAVVKGLSCRVFHYDVQYDAAGMPTSKSFLIVPEWTNGPNPFANPADLANARVLVNGQAFADVPATPSDAISEPYDALNLQNAFLAGIDFDSTPWVYSSFYHFGNADYEAFRPLPFRAVPLVDNDFDGRPDPEVDTDGDGIKDSIWIDLGYPVQTDSSGRQYKALVSVMILDLDPRFNLNYNGNGEDARGRSTATLPTYPILGNPAVVPQGQGYGPSDISLGRLFPPPGGFPATPANFNQEYYNLLGDPTSQYYGRFGPPGPSGVYATGDSEVQDEWSQYKLFGYPSSGIGNFFGSRLDLKGRYGWGFTANFDATGFLPISMPGIDVVPAFDDPGLMFYDYDLIDNPYEVNVVGYPSEGPSENSLVAGGSNRLDHLYSYKELERVYRTFDLDSKFLADRLLRLAPSLDATTPGNDPTRRLRVAVEGREVPVPPSNSTVELAIAIRAAATAAGVPPTALSQITTMLSADIVQGLKMDINRPFGNGVANNPQGWVDWYTSDGQGEVGEQVPYPQPTPPGGVINVDIDISRDGVATADAPGVARIQFAKELFVLAMLKLQGAGDFNSEGSPIEVDTDDRRALAQWVINVVDFRDPDSIMSPFEYDDNPFNGWITDGSLLTDETADGLDNDGNGLIDGADPNEQFTERVVVWGCERPELLISENIVGHDRRTEDESEGGTVTAGSDDDFDSRLVPVASAFIELYAPWVSGNDMTYPTELYVGDQLNLGQTTLVGGHPVWRIQFVRDGDSGNLHYDLTGAADARDMDPDGGLLTAANAYRYLYFTQPPAGYAPSAGAESFYPAAGFNTMLSVGQHAVVGSHGNLPVAAGQYVSTFGRRITALEGDLASFDFANTRSITLDPAAGEVRTRDFDPDPAVLAMVTRTRTNVVAIPVGEPRSFNLSDPPGGYLVDPADPTPLTPSLPLLNFLPVEDGLRFADALGAPVTRDEPIDYSHRVLHTSDVEFLALKDDHTEPSFRVMYLQRLANPLIDWDPVLNPYITVDGSSVNMTAYNGVTAVYDSSLTGPSNNGLPPPPSPEYDTGDRNRDFASFERGKSEKFPVPNRDPDPTSVDDRRLLWPEERRHIRVLPGPPPIVVDIDDIANPVELASELLGVDQHFFSSTIYESLGTHNDAYYGQIPTYPAIPPPTNSHPFTWLTWNNRPYVSQYELMLVPSKACSQLLKTFTAKAANDPYDITAAYPTGNGFEHIPNFFLQQAGGAPLPTVRLELYKLLDFVEVPSRYVGTERYFNANPATTMPVFGLAPPFNSISRFRYPGKANINTILDREFWSAVIGEYATDVPTGGPYLDYSIMNASRRDPVSGEFTNPFRETIDPTIGVNGGLLRRGAGTDALFGYDPGDFSFQNPHNNADRNVYFRYDAIQRLGNLVTTRSSVFTIWITVGYFEVDPATGLLNGTTPQACELGYDTGQVKRHRGFFIFDRSIPVGFEQGVDHNVERAIMVESYIE